MKKAEKEKARELRYEGYSINQIVEMLGVAKSSVSLWVRDIGLTEQQKQKISQNGRSVESVERRRVARLSNERSKRNFVYQEAVANISEITTDELFYLGIGLYWGEGSKTSRGSACFYNSDPQIIQVMMRFYREIGRVQEEKLKGRIHLHPHLDVKKAEQYWSQISGIPLRRFTKTAAQQSKSSKNKKDSLPYGTFSITVYDTNLYLKIMGWTEGVYKKLIPTSKQLPTKYEKHF